MTVVAVLYADAFPLIVVDSLVSQPVSIPIGIPTPLLVTPDVRIGNGNQPVGLGRKFWLLPDRSLFLYAGTIGSAQKLFDYLSDRLLPGLRYDDAMDRDAEAFRQSHTPANFSFIVIAPYDDRIERYAHGQVQESDSPNYGYVLAIGSGTKQALDLMERYPGVRPDSGDAIYANALNVAARLTQDYQDDWGTGSTVSAAACGGYFEVVPPNLYGQSFAYLYRTTAQIFLSSDSRGLRLSQFIAASQRDDETIVLVGRHLAIPVSPLGFSIEGACLKQYAIRATKANTVSEAPFDGKLRFGQITFVVVYVNGVPYCRQDGHAFKSLGIYTRGGNPVALLYEDDDADIADPETGERIGAGRLTFEIMSDPAHSPLARMRDRAYAAMDCPRCMNDTQS